MTSEAAGDVLKRSQDLPPRVLQRRRYCVDGSQGQQPLADDPSGGWEGPLPRGGRPHQADVPPSVEEGDPHRGGPPAGALRGYEQHRMRAMEASKQHGGQQQPRPPGWGGMGYEPKLAAGGGGPGLDSGLPPGGVIHEGGGIAPEASSVGVEPPAGAPHRGPPSAVPQGGVDAVGSLPPPPHSQEFPQAGIGSGAGGPAASGHGEAAGIHHDGGLMDGSGGGTRGWPPVGEGRRPPRMRPPGPPSGALALHAAVAEAGNAPLFVQTPHGHLRPVNVAAQRAARKLIPGGGAKADRGVRAAAAAAAAAFGARRQAEGLVDPVPPLRAHGSNPASTTLPPRGRGPGPRHMAGSRPSLGPSPHGGGAGPPPQQWGWGAMLPNEVWHEGEVPNRQFAAGAGAGRGPHTWHGAQS